MRVEVLSVHQYSGIRSSYHSLYGSTFALPLCIERVKAYGRVKITAITSCVLANIQSPATLLGTCSTAF